MVTAARAVITRCLREMADAIDRQPGQAGGAGGNGLARLDVVAGRDTHRVDWPGCGSFLLTTAQLVVVRELVEAMLWGRPDVDEQYLVRKTRTKFRRLEEVFAGSAAWGVLVVKGEGVATYRIAEAEAEAEAEE